MNLIKNSQDLDLSKNQIWKKIDDTVCSNKMISNNDSIVVGVSGGADSMLLITYLLNIRQKFNLKIIVANVEHGIRGQESVNDTKFVESFCENNNLKFKSVSINAIEEAKKSHKTVEEYSRDFRYEYFRSFNCDKIAVAHNLSDSIETVLFRIARGTSNAGCEGILPVNGNIIRPLINLSSEEIRNFINLCGIDYVIDSSNDDIKYSRNCIRNQIVPHFKNINSKFEEHFKDYIDSVIDDNEIINSYIDELYEDLLFDDKLNIDYLVKNYRHMLKRVIIRYSNSFGINLTHNQIELISKNYSSNYKIQVSDKYYLVIMDGFLYFENTSISNKKISFSYDTRVIDYQSFICDKMKYLNEYDFVCDYDKIIGDIIVRSRKTGDKISIYPRNVSKSIKKLFNELKIPSDMRDSKAIIENNNKVVGVAGYCVSNEVYCNENTRNVLLLNVSTEESNA